MNYKFLIKFSYRNLYRNPERSLIILAGLVLSVSFIIWAFNFNDSALIEIQNEITGHYTGDFQIAKKEFNLFTDKIPTYEMMYQQDIPIPLQELTPRVITPTFVSGQKKTVGALMVGIDGEKEKKTTNFYKSLSSGSFIDQTKVPNPIILGERLAKKLNVKLNDEIVVISLGVDGSIANDLFVLTGLLNFGGGDMEEKLVFTSINKAREFLSMPENSFHVLVGTKNRDQFVIPKNYQVIPWSKILQDVNLSINFMDKLNWLLTMIMVFVVSLGISNTLFVSFNEREKELTSLNIIGAKSKWISLSLLFEVLILLFIALILGNLLGAFATKYFYKNPIDIRAFTQGRDIMLGGMKINPIIRFYNFKINHIIASIMVSVFVILAMLFPIIKVMKRSLSAKTS